VDSDSYTVSFLKKNNDGSYSWPDRDDISTVQQHEIFLVKSPTEDIMPVAGARAVKIKLTFDQSDIHAARSFLNVPLTNIH
jgi:hypothetical protein